MSKSYSSHKSKTKHFFEISWFTYDHYMLFFNPGKYHPNRWYRRLAYGYLTYSFGRSLSIIYRRCVCVPFLCDHMKEIFNQIVEEKGQEEIVPVPISLCTWDTRDENKSERFASNIKLAFLHHLLLLVQENMMRKHMCFRFSSALLTRTMRKIRQLLL